jgi:hypothetical protein
MLVVFCGSAPQSVQAKGHQIGWLVCGVKHHFQQYFSYIVVDNFIGGGKQSFLHNISL